VPPITLYHSKSLIPHLAYIQDSQPPLYEAVIRYVGALQLYITLPSHEEIVIDYQCAEIDRMAVFQFTRLYLNDEGQVIHMA